MQATIRTEPPQAGQVSISILNTLFRRCAQVIDARRSAAVGSSASAAATAWPPLPRLAGVTRARYWLFGANTPWKRVRFTLGFGTSAARQSRDMAVAVGAGRVSELESQRRMAQPEYFGEKKRPVQAPAFFLVDNTND